MNLADGKSLALRVTDEVIDLIKNESSVPKITVIACEPNFETKKFLALKKAKAETLGVEMKNIILSNNNGTSELVETVETEAKKADGIIVQLPLPAHIDTDQVLGAIPKNKDVDAFGYEGEKTEILPPVVGAIEEMAKFYKIEWNGKKVVVFGQGRLVGKPVVAYATAMGAEVTIIDETSTDVKEKTKNADIIVLGVGRPNLLTADMVKEGVVVFDAGASEDGGLLVGDANLSVASKALLLTPVPGGIGPLTVILLFRNLLKLKSRQ
ncbi:MAG: bifunctional 5,10-methylenetetrahydrofolate dehydrogenase/5,10-methenyltetrahydrofolate cyclohydrolase [Candidatus Paceibacterota bacterium]